jgi:peptidoglycan/LPS O-acetylase OafA/YrhL
MMTEPATAPRLAYLETLRGIAALVVVLSHTLAAANLQGPPAGIVLAMMASPLSLLINGRGAVIFFFTLSGYVLTLRALETGDAGSIVRGALKRWPRLAGPVLLSTLLSWALWRRGLYFHTAAAGIAGNPWLLHFANGSLDLSNPPDMGLLAAIRQGVWSTFVSGADSFNSSLWTMSYEMAGSFAIYVAAFLVILFRNRFIPAAVVLLVVFGVMGWRDMLYPAFGIGLALACLHAAGRLVPPRPFAACLVLAAIYGFGYRGGAMTYIWLPIFDPEGAGATMICLTASAALISGVSAWPQARRGLSGRAGRLLGSLSFPIYLVHVPVILSLGCAALVVLQPGWGGNIASAGLAVASLIGTAGAAWLVWRADRRWVEALNRLIDVVWRFKNPPRFVPVKPARS